jgi:hypothetical protein
MIPGLLALLYTPALLAAAQAAPEKPFVERVEVNVRTVLVLITDANGRTPSPPPSPDDLEVLEDGAAVSVIGVDSARYAAPRQAPDPTPLPQGRRLEPPAAAPVAGIPQHLYLDTTLLESGSVARLAAAFQKNVDRVVANGTLEIVVGDPQPRRYLEPTRDREAIARALHALASGVAGKDSVARLRRQTFDVLRNALVPHAEMQLRSAAEQEVRLLTDALDRLARWAASLGGQRPDVVYFVSDGFDSDITEAYRQLLKRLGSGPAIAESTDPPDVVARRFQTEYGPRGGALVGEAARALAALGIQAVPLALGGNQKDFGGDASTSGPDGFASSAGTIPLFARPIEPLRAIADATGGEVVTSVNRLPVALDAYESAFVVSFRSRYADGRTHPLKIASRRAGLTIRSPRFLGEGSPDAVGRGTAVRALSEPPPAAGLPVRLAIDGVSAQGKQYAGTLHVDVDLATLAETLVVLQGGRVRVTMAVEVEGAREPFTTKQEFDVPARQAGWGADIPITWPRKTKKIAVTVEELRTGARGTSVADVPKAE